METWVQDVKYGVRTLLKRPAFTTVAVVSLALGIGANTAIFTVVNAVFNHPLAIADPTRVVELFTEDTRTVQGANLNLTPSSLQNFEDYRVAKAGLSALAGYFPFGLQLTLNGQTTGVPAMMSSANYFDVLGVKPVMGRFFSPDEDVNQAVPVAVLSYATWVNTFGSDQSIVGQAISLNNIPFSVIGVAPEGFKGTATLAGADLIWVPLGMRNQLITGQLLALSTNRRFRWINMVGRLQPGVSLEQAQTGLKLVATSLAEQYPDANLGRTIVLTSVTDAALGVNARSQFVKTGTVLMAVVGLVLLIACVNLANLLLAQSARREKEIAVRAAMGANRQRLIRQLLVESVVLSVGGGGLGLAVAYWGRSALWAFRPPFLGTASIDLSLDPTVLAFTAVVAVATGFIFGIVPAVKLSRTNLSETLKLGGRSGSADLGQNWVRRVLVAGEITLATVALIGSGLFVRSMQAAQHMDLGFDAQHIGYIGLDPAGQHYDQGHGLQFYDDAIAAAQRARGIQAAAVTSIVPLSFFGGGVLQTTFPEGQAQNSTYRGSLITYTDVTPGYFQTMRIPFQGGRDFNEFDREGSTLVAIVNDATARQLWPGQNAVGKRFTIVQQTQLYEVVGVVATSTIGAVGEDPTPQIYRPLRQEYSPAVALVYRTSDEPGARLGGVRDAVQALDRRMALRTTGTVHDQVALNLWASRMGAALLSIFGGLALTLAMIGVYGVMSYSVAQRTSEIGFRIAIGAQPASVLWLVMKQGLLLAGCGALIGVALAILGGRSIATLLYGIAPADPLTLGTVTGALMIVAVFACYIPARRATRVDPLVALRAE